MRVRFVTGLMSGRSMSFPALSFHRRPLAAAVAVLVASTLVAACGRSAPDDAAEGSSVISEPTAAGVQVVSELPVITPVPTTPTVPTTVATTQASVVAADTYEIVPGDTLSGIASRFGVTIAALSQANGIEDPNNIRPGQELIIPAAG